MKNKSEDWTFHLFFACIVVCASASFMFGYGIGAPNQYSKFTEPFLYGKYNACDVMDNVVLRQYGCENNATSAESTRAFNRDIFVMELRNGVGQTLFVIGNFIGALTGPLWFKMSHFFDRRRIFYANYPFALLSAAALLGSYHGKLASLYYISRFIHGYQGGMACVIVSPYLNEISPQKLRGTTGTFHQLFITIGILFGQFLGLRELFGRFKLWPYGLAFGSLSCLIAMFLIFMIPDSPSQLLNFFKNEHKAAATLRKLRKTNDISDELNSLRETRGDAYETKRLSIKEIFTNPKYKWQLTTTLVLFVVQALSGINAVFFYSTKMFTVAGISDYNLPYATLCTGLINVLVTLAVFPLIDRFGRRPLIIYPMGSMIILFITITTFVELNETRNSPVLAWITVVLTVCFIIAFAIGLGPVPFIYACEVFRSEARDAALSVSLAANYTCNILLCLFFPAINVFLRGYVFLIFAVIVSCGLSILFFKMPETKNKPIEAVESELRA